MSGKDDSNPVAIRIGANIKPVELAGVETVLEDVTVLLLAGVGTLDLRLAPPKNRRDRWLEGEVDSGIEGAPIWG